MQGPPRKDKGLKLLNYTYKLKATITACGLNQGSDIRSYFGVGINKTRCVTCEG